MDEYEKKASVGQDDIDQHHRKSSIASFAGGFQAVNILQNVKAADQGTTPHGDSTTFASAGLDAYYKPQPHWEGLHRYDPDFTWEPSDERRLVRKVIRDLAPAFSHGVADPDPARLEDMYLRLPDGKLKTCCHVCVY
jgi:hypothetical protein